MYHQYNISDQDHQLLNRCQ